LTTSSKKTSRELSDTKQAQPAPDGDRSSVLAELRERKEKQLADRIQLQTDIMCGGFVLRETVASAIGNIYALYRRQFLELDLSLGDVFCAVMSIPENESHNIRKIMSDLAYSTIRELQKQLVAFIEANGADENGEPAPDREKPRKKARA